MPATSTTEATWEKAETSLPSLSERLPAVLRRWRVATLAGPPSAAWWGAILGVAVVYFITANIGLMFAMQGGVVTPVWPPSGIVLAALLVFGRRLWPGVWAGALAANLHGILQDPNPGPFGPALAAAVGMSTGATLLGWFGFGLVGRFIRDRHPLDRVRDVWASITLGGPLACVVSASFGATSLALSGVAQWSAFGQIWLTWWLGDMAGVILFMPFLLAWSTRPAFPRSAGFVELVVCAALTVAAAQLVFGSGNALGFSGKSLLFILLPVVVWPGLRFGQRGAATGALVVAGMSVHATTRGHGPFQLGSLNESLLVLELFLSTVSGIALCVAAVVVERRDAEARRGALLAELESRVDKRTAEVKESEARFRLLADTAPAHIWMTDAAGHCTYVNKVWLDFTGRGPGQEPGESWLDRLHADDRPLFDEVSCAAQVDGRAFELECRMQRADGEWRWLLLHASPRRRADGGFDGFIGSGFDITDHRAAEESARQAQKMESIGQLAGGVAHDFNNILTIILGRVELLRDRQESFDSETQETVEEIEEAARRAATLTRQLLAFGRRQFMQPRLLDLTEVVAGMTKMLSRLVGEDIDLRLLHDRDRRLPVVRADAGMVEQVLMNLAVNARHAMPAGGCLTIGLSGVDIEPGETGRHGEGQAGQHVKLSVADNGVGIKPEHLPHIFEPFFTTRGVGEGTGMGLATVYGIVRQHRGWIDVASEVGAGTTFHIFLPAVSAAIEREFTATESGIDHDGSETILIVEDEPAVLGMAVRALRRRGYQTLQAISGPDALEVFERADGRVDLLFSDVVMPGGMDGRELSRQLLVRRPDLGVVLASGYTEEILDKDFVVEEGVNFLPKPYTPDQLARVIRTCLDRTDSDG